MKNLSKLLMVLSVMAVSSQTFAVETPVKCKAKADQSEVTRASNGSTQAAVAKPKSATGR